jgi:hypothetical protein
MSKDKTIIYTIKLAYPAGVLLELDRDVLEALREYGAAEVVNVELSEDTWEIVAKRMWDEQEKDIANKRKGATEPQ